jgi:hypothetical protein
MHTALSGRSARVIGVRSHRHAQTLDKYVVIPIDSVDQHTLWDIELKPAAESVGTTSRPA